MARCSAHRLWQPPLRFFAAQRAFMTSCETIRSDRKYRFIIQDHDTILSSDFDAALARLVSK
jgi:hypothetical protein